MKDRVYATSKNLKIDWVESLSYVELGLRATVTTATGFSPNAVIFGDRLNLPWNNNNTNGYTGCNEYIIEVSRKI